MGKHLSYLCYRHIKSYAPFAGQEQRLSSRQSLSSDAALKKISHKFPLIILISTNALLVCRTDKKNSKFKVKKRRKKLINKYPENKNNKFNKRLKTFLNAFDLIFFW